MVLWFYEAHQGCAGTSWQERAAQATRIAQELEQAATESVEALEAVLHSQSWDHRVVSKMHSGKLREMEMDSFQEELVELQQGRRQVFMAKIRRQEREDQHEMAKKEKTIRFKQQELVMLEP